MLKAAVSSSSDYRSRLWAAVLAFVVGILLLALKSTGAVLTGSSAVLSDALESIVNVLTGGVGILVIRFAAQPADREHPYGHGKAEFISAAFEGGLVAFAAVTIALESARALWRGVEIREVQWGLIIVGAAAVVNLILGLHLRRIGRRANSEALLASSIHVLSDVKTTVGSIIALVAVSWTGLWWLDPLIALAIAGHLGWEGVTVVRRSFAGLIDSTDQDSLGKLAAAIQRFRQPGIINIHHLRAIRSGAFHHIDAHIVVPEFWDVSRVHDLTDEFERQVVGAYPFEGEFAFHVDPCRRKFCALCDIMTCPIRQTPFQSLSAFDVDSMTGEAQT